MDSSAGRPELMVLKIITKNIERACYHLQTEVCIAVENNRRVAIEDFEFLYICIVIISVYNVRKISLKGNFDNIDEIDIGCMFVCIPPAECPGVRRARSDTRRCACRCPPST
jgi:hypothetical protein